MQWCPVVRKCAGFSESVDVHDQRIKERALFDTEDSFKSGALSDVAGEAIDGLGGKAQDLPGLEHCDRPFNRHNYSHTLAGWRVPWRR